MDAVLTSLIGAAPQLGVGSGLVVFFVLLVRSQVQDRADHRAQMAEERAGHATELRDITGRHDAELARINADHDAELGELRKEIRGLRNQLAEVNRKLDEERALRRRAEDTRRQNPARGRLQGDPPWPA